MNTGRSRRSRPPTGRTNLSQTVTSLLGTQRTGVLVPVSPERKTRSLRPFSAGEEPAHDDLHTKHFGHFTDVKDPASITTGAKTRTELLATRKYDRAHFYDRYDLDGDGVVDPYEVRLGALVDLDGNGEISQDEKDYLRDLIETGKLKEISFLNDKEGGNAKKALTWIGSREWRRQQAEAEEARAARMERMRLGYDSKRIAKNVAGALVSDTNELHSNEELLGKLAESLEPLKSDAFQRALRAALHNGTGPMDRTMSGRHTPGLEYKHEPLHKTRSELLEARKKMGAVNMAYDLDGDGSVDPIEYLVASLLDVNKDGVLSEEEKKNAGVLIERLRKHYITGLDSHGTNTHGIRIHQRNGKIMSDVAEYDVSDSAGRLIVSDAARSGPPSPGENYSPTLQRPFSRSTLTPSQRESTPGTPSTPVQVSPGQRSIWSPNPGVSSPFFRNSPGSSRLLSRAGSSSLAEDLKRSASSPLVMRPVTLGGDGSGHSEVLRLPSSGRPATGMSHLLGV